MTTDVALTASPARREHWGVDRLPPPNKAARTREHPPIAETPEWAWPLAPERDEAALALFPQEYASAKKFWEWLTDTYVGIRARMWTGYRYLDALDGKDDDAETLYQTLGAWLHWLEAAWWLLTQWYSEDNRCRWLCLPLPVAALDGKRVVREYRGLKGEVLLEEALRLWRDYAILTHQLPDVGEAPPDVEPTLKPPPAPRTVGTVTRGARLVDADLRPARVSEEAKPDLQAMSQLPATAHQLRALAAHDVTADGDAPWPPTRNRAAELLGDAIVQKTGQEVPA